MDKKIDVRNKYSVELMNINNKLNQPRSSKISIVEHFRCYREMDDSYI